MQCLFLTLYDDRAGTREVHNKLEKNRRAHLRECFEFLRKQLPAIDDKKLSNLGILKSALRFIQVKINLLLVLPFLLLFFFWPSVQYYYVHFGAACLLLCNNMSRDIRGIEK